MLCSAASLSRKPALQFTVKCILYSLYTHRAFFFPFFVFADINKGSPIEYKTGNSACSTPTKDTLKSYDRNCIGGPVLPPRSTMMGPPSHHYSAPLNFRKGLASKCTWKCTAIIVILLSVVLTCTIIYMTSKLKQFFTFNYLNRVQPGYF